MSKKFRKNLKNNLTALQRYGKNQYIVLFGEKINLLLCDK